MALFRGTVRSTVLEMDTQVNVIIPYDYHHGEEKQVKYDKVLYLLHGLKQNADAWQRFSSVERYAQEYGFVVIMPEVQRSFYTDMAMGLPYFTYLSEELPGMMQEMFNIACDREHTYVGGLSMGGYGALKCALLRPDRYAGALCFSSGFFVLENAGVSKGVWKNDEMKAIIGADLICPDCDRLDLVMDGFTPDMKKPKVYLACGTEDYLYKNNVMMRDVLQEKGFAPVYEEWGGVHDWLFWDLAVQRGMQCVCETWIKNK